jgi:pilus assembly protein Flp/PilA
MERARDIARRFERHEAGATAIEYALIAGFIALALIASVPGIAAAVGAIFTSLATGLAGA